MISGCHLSLPRLINYSRGLITWNFRDSERQMGVWKQGVGNGLHHSCALLIDAACDLIVKLSEHSNIPKSFQIYKQYSFPWVLLSLSSGFANLSNDAIWWTMMIIKSITTLTLQKRALNFKSVKIINLPSFQMYIAKLFALTFQEHSDAEQFCSKL